MSEIKNYKGIDKYFQRKKNVWYTF